MLRFTLPECEMWPRPSSRFEADTYGDYYITYESPSGGSILIPVSPHYRSNLATPLQL